MGVVLRWIREEQAWEKKGKRDEKGQWSVSRLLVSMFI